MRDLKLLVLQMGAIVPCCLPRPDWRLQRWSPPRVKPIDAPRRYWLKSPLPRLNVDAQRPHLPANDRGDSPAIANPPSWVGKAPPPYLFWPVNYHYQRECRDRADPSQWPRDRPPPVNVQLGFTGPPVKPPPPLLVRPPQGPPPFKPPPPPFKAPPCFRG